LLLMEIKYKENSIIKRKHFLSIAISGRSSNAIILNTWHLERHPRKLNPQHSPD